MRKIYYFVILLSLGVLLAACGGDAAATEDEASPIGLVLDDLYFTQSSIIRTDNLRFAQVTEPFGRHISTTANGRNYFFANDDYEANTQFVYATESIIAELESMGAMGDASIWIFYADDFERRHIGLAGIAINHADPTAMGWIVAASTGGRVPIWLAVGVEAVARSNADLFNPAEVDMPDYFGDMHFQPAVWGSAAQMQSIYAAYHFTQYILGSGYFSKLFEMYLDGEHDAANELANSLMHSFAGQAMETRFRLNYFDTPNFGLRQSRPARYNIYISTDVGIYRFLFDSFDESLSFDLLVRYINFSDESIWFVKDWFGRYTDIEWSPMVTDLVYGMYEWTWAYPHTVGMEMQISHYLAGTFYIPFLMAHEAVHVMSFRMNNSRGMAIRMFEEGLAMALQHKHETIDFRNLGYTYLHFTYRLGNREQWHPDMLQLNRFYSIFRDAHVVYYAAWLFLNGMDITLDNHWTAYYLLNICEIGIGDGSLFDTTHPIAPELGSYETAGSFVAFLLETYGAEKYLRVHHGMPIRPTGDRTHWEFPLFEEVYGVTIYEMVERWLVFLREQIEAVVVSANS